MKGSYRKRIWISNLILLVLVAAITLLLSFYAAREVLLDNLMQAGRQRIQELSQKNSQAMEMAQGFLESEAIAPWVVGTTQKLGAAGTAYEYVEARESARQMIITLQNVCSPISKIYLKADTLLLGETLETHIHAESDGIANEGYKNLIAGRVLQRYVRANLFPGKRYGVIAAPLEGNNAIACVLDWIEIYQVGSSEGLCVFGSDGVLDFQSENAAELTPEGEPPRAILQEASSSGNGYALRRMGDRTVIAVALCIGGEECFLLLRDCTRELGTLFEEGLIEQLWLILFLFGIAIPLFWIGSGMVMRPIWRLIDAVNAVQRDSPREAIYPMVMDVRRQSSIKRRIFLHGLLILPFVAALVLTSALRYSGVVERQSGELFEASAGSFSEQVAFTARQQRDLVNQIAFGRLFQNDLQTLRDGAEQEKVQAQLAVRELIYQNQYLFNNVRKLNFYDADGTLLYSHTGDALSQEAAAGRLRSLSGSKISYLQPQGNHIASAWIPLRDHTSWELWGVLPTEYWVELEIGHYLQDVAYTPAAMDSLALLYDSGSRQVIFHTGFAEYPLRILEGMCQGRMLCPGESREVLIPAETGSGQEKLFIAVSLPVERTDYSLVYTVPLETVQAQSAQVWRINLLLLAGAMLAICLLATGITFYMLRPLRRLQNFFNEAYKTAEPFHVPSIFDSELAQLALAFDGLLSRMGALQDFLRKKELDYAELKLRKTEMELMALRTQIDPHLMSNLFVTMRFLVHAGKTSELERMLAVVGRFLHDSAGKGGMVELEKELQQVDSYVGIQNIRYGGRLTFTAATEPKAQRVKVPQFLLQPIVENAIMHGAADGRTLHIAVTAAIDGKNLRIVVENDGLPILQETLDRLNGNAGSVPPDSKGHIGFVNTVERVRLVYGPSARVQIENLPETGVRVTMWLPAVTLKRAQED